MVQSGFNHNGGTLMFGPLGMLLLSLGDGGGFTGSQHGQEFDNLLGTVIRWVERACRFIAPTIYQLAAGPGSM